MAQRSFSEDDLVLGGGLAGAAADGTANCEQRRAQRVETSDAGCETPGDESGMDGPIARPRKHHARWGGEASEGGSSASADLAGKRKQLRVRWADDVGDAPASADAAPPTLRGLLKKALGRSKARRWLLSLALVTDGNCEEWLHDVAATFAALRIEEGASMDQVKAELLALTSVLIQGVDISSHCKGYRTEASGGVSGARKGPQRMDTKGKKPKPEDEISLITATVTVVQEWFQWYSQHITRSG